MDSIHTRSTVSSQHSLDYQRVRSLPFIAPEDTDLLFDKFCDGIFNHPWLRTHSTKKLLTVELGTGQESGRFAARFQKRPASYCIREKPGAKNYGWRTTAFSKNAYTQQLWTKMGEGAIFYLDDMVCVNPWLPEDSRREKTVNEFEAQLARFKVVTKKNANPFAPGSVTTSGKVGEDGNLQQGVNDDMAMALAMNLYITLRMQTRTIPGLDYNTLLGDELRYRGLRKRENGDSGKQDASEQRKRRRGM